jgi:hypothetical protein
LVIGSWFSVFSFRFSGICLRFTDHALRITVFRESPPPPLWKRGETCPADPHAPQTTSRFTISRFTTARPPRPPHPGLRFPTTSPPTISRFTIYDFTTSRLHDLRFHDSRLHAPHGPRTPDYASPRLPHPRFHDSRFTTSRLHDLRFHDLRFHDSRLHAPTHHPSPIPRHPPRTPLAQPTCTKGVQVVDKIFVSIYLIGAFKAQAVFPGGEEKTSYFFVPQCDFFLLKATPYQRNRNQRSR